MTSSDAAYKHDWYSSHKEKCKARAAKWSREHPELTAIYNRNWRLANIARCAKHARDSHHRHGGRPLHEASDCGAYLGVHVAETLLARIDDNIQRMPYGNRGFDLVFNDAKIDVKSACRTHRVGKNDSWIFQIKRNQEADLFACLAFNDRSSLILEHFWLIPRDIICNKTSLTITTSKLGKWIAYETSLKNLQILREFEHDTPK